MLNYPAGMLNLNIGCIEISRIPCLPALADLLNLNIGCIEMHPSTYTPLERFIVEP